ncbi:hypothetical protein IKG33_01330 [Candidatus Saccharibacteria bacterium]|nr:hypothetical protein [Candidatus Saccharibacteria bacterium]
MKNHFKKGAASFYIVAFSTLILVIIAASFAAIIVSEMTRTSNDDLAQSAYDSALAGIEDAKLAVANYQTCAQSNAGVADGLNKDGNLSCSEIRYLVEESNSCDMVGYITGRLKDTPDEKVGEILVQESSTAGQGNNMQQAYTCVKIDMSPDNYTATMSERSPTKVIKLKFEEFNGQPVEPLIKRVKISWLSGSNNTSNSYTNFKEEGEDKGVTFPSISNMFKPATPPTISVGFIQTGENFTLDDFGMTRNGQTDRAMVYLVPTDSKTLARQRKDDNYIGAYNGSENVVGVNEVLKSNDKTVKNLPYAVYCPEDSTEFSCSTTIELPDPIGGTRNSETFVFVVSLPYGKPTTDFKLEFLCDVNCGTLKTYTVNDEGGVDEHSEDKTQALLDGIQIKIDSTGRANDLFRRVETRLEPEDNLSLSILGPLELLGEGGGDALKKDYAVTKEWNFR